MTITANGHTITVTTEAELMKFIERVAPTIPRTLAPTAPEKRS